MRARVILYLTVVLDIQAFDKTESSRNTERGLAWPLRCTLASSLLLGNVVVRMHLLQGHTTPNFTYMDNPLWFYESLIDRVLGTMQVRAAVLMH